MIPDILLKEITYQSVRSSGAGGQHVNKVSSKVVLSFDVVRSNGLNEQEKERLLINLKTRLTQQGVLQLSCDDSRSQHRNKTIVTNRFLALLRLNLIPSKTRRRTKPTKASVQRRIKNKKLLSQKKRDRRRPIGD